MRKLSLIMVLLFCATFTYAQKGKVTQANSHFTAGKLDQAKKMIDEAMKHEACADYVKGYFTKGQIYQALFESPVKDYKKLDPNALNVAWDAYQKVIELDEKNRYESKLEEQYKNLVIDFTNKAIEFYNASNFESALMTFEKVLEIKNSPILVKGGAVSVDTAIIFNAAVAAQRGGNLVAAEKHYKEALKYNYEAAKIYPMLANVLKEQGKKEESIEYLHKGYELFPNDSYMIVELINYYVLGGEPEKAEVYLDAAIKQDPKNGSFYRVKGTLYEKIKEIAKAEAMYTKALELDPKDFIAQYNLGNIKLTEAINVHKKVMDIVDVDEYNKAMEKVFSSYAVAVQYFEKALEIKPDEKNAMVTLKELYFKLRNENAEYQKKFEAIEEKLKK